MIPKKFYDSHFHVMDLSHANLMAFLLREDLITKETIRDFSRKMKWWMKLIPLGAIDLAPGVIVRKLKEFLEGPSKVKNLLSFMENSIRFDFLIVEHFLKKGKEGKERMITSDNLFLVDDVLYNKIVLCPLVIDFRYKNMQQKGIFYNLPPNKSVIDQTADLLTAIAHYMQYELVPSTEFPDRLHVTSYGGYRKGKLFEIYPFLGLNPQNDYTLDQIKRIFKKYFSGFDLDTPKRRSELLLQKMGTYGGTFEGIDLSYFFAGIKFYPPLGFDPWPENDLLELQKNCYIYEQCIRKRIPVTTHCSNGGFITDPNAETYTHPGKQWFKVLKHYPELKLNFAHFGARNDHQTHWREQIIDYLLNKDYENVYTDFSCRGFTTDKQEHHFYDEVEELIETYGNKVCDQMLFGSDFMINLLWTDSYNQYLANFKYTEALRGHKEQICSINPERFLFG
ncbi:MAG: amidohydrolase [Bacteroidales bacterium]|nr:amidohydrolase [Bacteroidales bacterium]